MSEVEPSKLHIPAQLSPGDDEETIFRLPDELKDDPRFESLYKEIVSRLQKEAEGIQLNVLQELLIERLSSLYVIIKNHDENGTWLPRQQREYNQQWLEMMKVFSQITLANAEAKQEAFMGRLQQAITTAVNRHPDPEQRKVFQQLLADEFTKAGI